MTLRLHSPLPIAFLLPGLLLAAGIALGGLALVLLAIVAGMLAVDRVLARTAGFDTLYVDIEHSSFSLDTCGQICMAALEAGIAPFVRVPANTPDYIARVLEGGALGIIAPHVRSADEARAVVRAAKFSPLGERSNAGGLPHLHFRSFSAPEAYAALNEATMVIVQFESAAALDKTLDEPATAEKLEKLGGTVPPKSERGPEYLRKTVASDIPRWAPILKEAAETTKAN